MKVAYCNRDFENLLLIEIKRQGGHFLQHSANKKGSELRFPFLKLEREKSLELSTSTLARLRSTN